MFLTIVLQPFGWIVCGDLLDLFVRKSFCMESWQYVIDNMTVAMSAEFNL